MVRISKYTYDFTRAGSSEATTQRKWWTRTRIGEYLPPLSLENPSLQQFLREHDVQPVRSARDKSKRADGQDDGDSKGAWLVIMSWNSAVSLVRHVHGYTYMYAYKETYMYTYKDTYMHACMHTHTHTHTHTHIHIGINCAVVEVARAAGGAGGLCVGACRDVAAACLALAARKKTPETRTGAPGTES